MTAEASTFLAGFFAHVWKLFNGWKLPGTNVTPISWALFLLLLPVFIRLFKRLLNTPDASGGGSSRKAGDSK